MKSDKGITLIALIIMILIITILAGVIVNSGMGAYKEAKLTQFVARMNMIQSRVNVAYTDIKAENKKIEDYGVSADSVNGSIKNKISNIIPGGNISDYRYLSKTDLDQDLGLQDLNEEIIVNFNTREIYNLEGIEYDGVIYYNQYHLPNGEYNIDFENKTGEAPEFNLSKRNYGLYSYIDVEDIVYKENIGEGKIYYALITGENSGNVVVDYWRETEEEISIEKTGEYVVKVVDKAGNETVKRVNVVLENAPKLTEDMTAVVYDESKKQWKKANIEEGKWYDYGENKWANIMMNDGIQIDSNGYITSYGSMFVWIPRYAYNIKNGFHSSTAGDIEVKFLKGTTTLTTDESNITYSQTSGNDKWLIHPAFEDGTKNGYANGEWDKKIEGIWMAKFETSMETNGTHTETSSGTIGNVLTNNSIKAVSKPGVSSWRYIDIGNIYANSLNYNKRANSHMIKNSEWGAVAYLTYSKYGRNKQDITINNSSTYITGNAGNTVGASDAPGITNAYDTEKGVLASTTGNIYGVYDMSGGAFEYTANMIPVEHEYITEYGGEIANIKNSNKYFTMYPIGGSTNEIVGITESYSSWSSIYGDAIWEVSNKTDGINCWNSDDTDSDSIYDEMFFIRGGLYRLENSAGIFAYGDIGGCDAGDSTSRIVLIVEEKTLPKVDENGLATEDTTITTDDPNVQIVIPKGFAPVILQTDRTDSMPGENGAVKVIMPVEDWEKISAEQINKGIVVVDHAITYDNGQPSGTVPDFNEYVWVPMPDSSKFKRVAWNGPYWNGSTLKNGTHPIADVSTSNKYWEETASSEYTSMVSSVGLNKGFYISRYEASKKDGSTAQSKRGRTPWVSVSQITAKTASSNMKPSINSHLIYGIEWDSVLQWALDSQAIIGSESGETKTITEDDIQKDSRSWGNYKNSTGGAAANSGSSAKVGGTNEYWKVNNIYDIAGNASEWTQEKFSTDTRRASRGGNCYLDGGIYPAAYRYNYYESNTSYDLRF